jgi:actin-related protein
MSQRFLLIEDSRWIRGGIAGDTEPLEVFSNVIGRPLYRHSTTPSKIVYRGEECDSMIGTVKTEWALDRGVVQNWDCMVETLGHMFYNKLGIAPQEHALVSIILRSLR